MSNVRIKTINFTPSFSGRHNEIRCKCWLLLYDRYLGKKRGLKLVELVQMGNFNYKSLTVLLSRWIRWRYVGARSRPGGREYSLRKRGRAWLQRWWDVLPLDRYIQEIETHQRGE